MKGGEQRSCLVPLVSGIMTVQLALHARVVGRVHTAPEAQFSELGARQGRKTLTNPL